MKLKFLTLPFFLFLLLSLMSCDNDDDNNNNECIENYIAYVVSVNSVDSGTVNESINIEVKFGVSNGCGGFGKFIETKNGNTRTIEVEAKYTGCICTQNAPIITTNYKFITNKAGNYELNFKSSPTEYITVNLIIN
ncbi:MAG TPA: hypothetical protein VIN72_01470 [Lutibacter sp.]